MRHLHDHRALSDTVKTFFWLTNLLRRERRPCSVASCWGMGHPDAHDRRPWRPDPTSLPPEGTFESGHRCDRPTIPSGDHGWQASTNRSSAMILSLDRIVVGSYTRRRLRLPWLRCPNAIPAERSYARHPERDLRAIRVTFDGGPASAPQPPFRRALSGVPSGRAPGTISTRRHARSPND
jgi:hypothetical protein